MSWTGTMKTNRIVDDKKIQHDNLNVVIDLFRSLKKDSTAELFDVTHSSVPQENKE